MGRFGAYAFSDCENLEDLQIPESVTSIGDQAFAYSDKLILTVLPNTYGERWALNNDVRFQVLTDGEYSPVVNASGTCGDSLIWMLDENGLLTIEGSGEMYNYSGNAPWYYVNDSISEVSISEGVVSVGSYAFYDCDSLEKVCFPASVLTIGNCAFYDCAALNELDLSEGLTTINDCAFQYCAALTEVTAPESLVNFGTNVFDGCVNLSLIVAQDSAARAYAIRNGLRFTTLGESRGIVDQGSCGSSMVWILYDDGTLELEGTGDMYGYSNDSHHTTAPWYSYCQQITGLVLKEGITGIGSYAFYGETYLTQSYRFTGLTEVVLPNSLTKIEYNAFDGCTELASMTIPPSVTNIYSDAFANCDKLTLTVAEGSMAQVYAIENNISHTVGGNTVLHSGTCGEYGGDGVFWMLYDNGTLMIQGNGKMQDYYVKNYQDAPHTTAPWYPYRDQISNVVVSEGVTSIGGYAFYGGTLYTADFRFNNLTKIDLPNSLTLIGDYAFGGCVGLTELSVLGNTEEGEDGVARNLPSGLAGIGSSAFNKCEALESLTLPKELNSIGTDAFSDCPVLRILVYPDSYAELYAIQNNVKHSVVGKEDDPPVASGTCGENLNWLLYSDGTLIFQGSGEMSDYNVYYDYNDGVSHPRTSAPWGEYSDRITAVVIPQGVTRLGSYAFYGDKEYSVDYRFSRLKSINLPNSLTHIGVYAFAGCFAVEELTLPSALRVIGANSFANCAALRELVLPNQVTAIGNDAFLNCEALTLVVDRESYGRAYALQNGVRHTLTEDPENVILASGPCGTEQWNGSQYVSDLYWLFEESGKLVFEGTGRMNDYYSENSHSTAPWYPYCGQITTVVIPSGVTSIGDYAFYGMRYYNDDFRFTALSSVIIPDSVTEIGRSAFQSCISLSTLTIAPTVASIDEDAFSDCSNLTLTVYNDSAGRDYALRNSVRHVLNGDTRTVLASGACGTDNYWDENRYISNLYWLFYANGSLEFQGTGRMLDYSGNRYSSDAPWNIYRTSITSVTIPYGVTSIGSYAFFGSVYYSKDYRYGNLASVSIPETVTDIGSYAFSGCAGLTQISLPPELNALSYGVLSGCTGLAGLSIPDAVTEINSEALSGCTGLRELLLSKNVDYIGENAFSGCRDLTLKVYQDSYAQYYAENYQLRHQIVESGEIVPGANPVEDPGNDDEINPAAPFEVTRDAYKFVNQASSFNYPSGVLSGDNYPISYNSFKVIFGDSVAGKSKYRQTKMNQWGGNCAGLSSSAALMYAGVDLTPSSFSKSSINSLSITDSSGEISLITFIEAMQVAQYTDAFAKDYQSNKLQNAELSAGKTLNALIQNVGADAGKGKCAVIAIGKQGVGAHALLAYGLESTSDNDYTLYIYDCNFPDQVRGISMTGSNGSITQWSYDMGSYGVWGTGDTGCFISFIPFDTIRSIWLNRGSAYQPKEMLSVNSDNISIQDVSGNEVARLENGRLVTSSTEIFEVPELSMFWPDTNSLYLPKDLYTVVSTDNQPLEASMTDRNLEATVKTSSSSVTFAVDDASRENTVFIDGMTENDSYTVELSSSFMDSQYETLSIQGSGSQETAETISISGARDALALSSNITYETLSISAPDGSQQKIENRKTISALSDSNGTILPRGDVMVAEGKAQLFEFLPRPGYMVSGVKVDGMDVGVLGSYTFYNVNDSHTISVSFEKGYEIGGASLDRSSNTVSVTSLMNSAASTLWGMVYDANGCFAGFTTCSVPAGAASATLSLGEKLPADYSVKLVLMDSGSRPLCDPYIL